MRIKPLSLLIVGTVNLLSAQLAFAEQSNIDTAWVNEQVPIAWADCIPVPVMPAPAPMTNIFPYPTGLMPPMPYMDHIGGQPTALLPPPSPFFNPAELPIPFTAPQVASNQISCDNSDTIKLDKLQSHYNRAAAASKARINKLQHALDDIQNQMADSRSIIDNLENKLSSHSSEEGETKLDQAKFKILQSTYQQQNTINTELKKQLAETETTKQNLRKELDKIKEVSTAQTQKLTALTQRDIEFKVLQTTHQHQNIANYELKKKLTAAETAKQTLTIELENIKEIGAAQNQKLTALTQRDTELKALQTTHQHQNIENYELKKKLTINETTNKDLQAQITKLNDDASTQAEKLGILNQIATEFKVLQQAYQLRNSELDELSSMLTESDITQKFQTKKLSVLGQTATEFKVLQEAYQQRTSEISTLKSQLTDFENLQTNLQNKLSTFEKSAIKRSKKLSALEQTETKFKVLQDTYKLRAEEITSLENLLTESNNSKESLQSKLTDIEGSLHTQTQQLTVLEQASNKLEILQESYKQRTNEITALEKLLGESENTKKGLQTKLSDIEGNLDVQNQRLAALGEESNKFKILQDSYKQRTDEISALEKLFAESESTKKGLQTKLSDTEGSLDSQAKKLTVLEQDSNKLNILQGAYKQRTEEISALEKQLAESENTKKELQSKLSAIEGDLDAQTQKLTILEQESNKLKILQEAYKLRTNEIAEFKSLITESDLTQNTLQEKLKTLEENSGVQAQKLSVLSQTATEYQVLQEAYQLQNYDVIRLKKRMVELDTEKKALQIKLEALKEGRNDLNDQLGSLQKTDSELQNAYALRSKENTELEQKLTGIASKNKSLQTKLSSLETDAASQAKKLVALGKSTTELSELQKTYNDRLNEIAELKSKLATMDDEYKSLQAKLTKVESNFDDQAKKLTTLGNTAVEFSALQVAYKERSNTNTGLKNKLTEIDSSYKELQLKLKTSESGATTQLNKAANNLSALQLAYKGSIDENTILKKKQSEINDANKTLQTKLGSLESIAIDQTKKINILGKSASELTALQSSYKESERSIVALKNKLANMGKTNTALQAKLTDLQSNAANQAKKLASLGKSTTELGELQKAYKTKLNEIAEQKSKLANMKNAHDSLQEKLTTVESSAADQAKQLTVLGKSKTELASLKGAYKSSNDENAKLKRKIAEHIKSCNGNTKACKLEVARLKETTSKSNDANKSLLAKITTFEKTASDQASQITTLMTTASELKPLQKAYSDLNAKLTAATADGDSDGVLDQRDKCPTTPAGTEVDLWGCFSDSDKDGIANSIDQCLKSPEGSTVNEVGCPPIKDADNDGIADKNDLCPTTKTGQKVNSFGCKPSENITLKGVNFATGSATIINSSLPILDRAANTLINNPTLRIEIAGHTDDQGLAQRNRSLSQRRANSVMIYLIKKGADANKLTAKGYGESQPIATNGTNEGRAINRRVEMKIK